MKNLLRQKCFGYAIGEEGGLELDRLLLGFFLDDFDAMKAHWREPFKFEYRGFWNLTNRVAKEFLVGGVRRRLHLSQGATWLKLRTVVRKVGCLVNKGSLSKILWWMNSFVLSPTRCCHASGSISTPIRLHHVAYAVSLSKFPLFIFSWVKSLFQRFTKLGINFLGLSQFYSRILSRFILEQSPNEFIEFKNN